jgi:hypothetical protein
MTFGAGDDGEATGEEALLSPRWLVSARTVESATSEEIGERPAVEDDGGRVC